MLFWPETPLPSSARIELEHSLAPGLVRVDARIRADGGGWSGFCCEGGVVAAEIELPKQAIAALSSEIDSTEVNTSPSISIIIVNFEQPYLTYACAKRAIYSAGAIQTEIIVVDNGSREASYRQLVEMDLPARLIRLDRPTSFSTANNLAAETARGKHLLFLNNDAFLDDGVAEKLLAEMASEEVGAAGPIFLKSRRLLPGIRRIHRRQRQLHAANLRGVPVGSARCFRRGLHLGRLSHGPQVGVPQDWRF